MNTLCSPSDLALSLMGDIRNLMLTSRTHANLTQFCERMVTSILSMAPETVINEYNGRDFLPMIGRLNQEVAARLHAHEQARTSPSAVHIWIIHDAERLSAAQQSLICRLMESFPALPFRVIWLSSQAPSEWQNPDGFDRIVLDLDAAAPTNTTPRSGMPFDKPLKMGIALAGTALLGSWVWMTSFAPSAVPTRNTPSPAANAPARNQASDAATSVEVSAPVKIAGPSSGSTQNEPRSTSQDELPLPAIVRAGERWLKSLPADSHVVEHGAFNTLEQAQKFQSKHKELDMAHVLAVRKTPEALNWQYTVVTGHFRSEDRAKRYVSRLDWRASTRIRNTDKLKPLVASAP